MMKINIDFFRKNLCYLLGLSLMMSAAVLAGQQDFTTALAVVEQTNHFSDHFEMSTNIDQNEKSRTIVEEATVTKSKLVIPAYKHPYDGVNNISDNAFWNDIKAAADILQDRLVVIISIPDSLTAGDVTAYQEVINDLQSKSATILGYNSLYYGKVDVQDNPYSFKRRLRLYRTMWYNTFDIDGIFYDETSLTGLCAELLVPFYNETQAAKAGDQVVIYNPGTLVNNSASWDGHGGWFVPFENYENEFIGKASSLNAMNSTHKDRSVIMIHTMNSGNWKTKIDALKQNGFHNFYLTDDILEFDSDGKEIASPYDVLPSFFMNLVNYIK